MTTYASMRRISVLRVNVRVRPCHKLTQRARGAIHV